jgi:hypothetical protein
MHFGAVLRLSPKSSKAVSPQISGRAPDEIRLGGQPQDREGARPAFLLRADTVID